MTSPASAPPDQADGPEATAGIDDLLRYEEEPVTPRRRSWLGTAIKSVLLIAVGTAAALFGLKVAGLTAPLVVVATAVAAVVALWHLVRQVAPTAGGPGAGPGPTSNVRRMPAEPDGHDGAYYWPVPDGMRRGVARWERRLAWQTDSPASFAQQLRPKLRELADERLRQAYGVTIGTDPARARTVLGEPLWGILTGDADQAPSRRELAQAVTRLEELYVTSTSEGAVRG